MYAGEVGAPGVLSTTFRGLLDGGTLTGGQGAKLAQLIGDRRTLLIFGERATGKSTLLNSLFELVSRGRPLRRRRARPGPARPEGTLVLRASRRGRRHRRRLACSPRRGAWTPGRLVVGEIQPRGGPRVLQSARGGPPHRRPGDPSRREREPGSSTPSSQPSGGDDVYARELIVPRRSPVFVHMHSDEIGRPRLAAIWSVAGLVDGELVLEEVDTGAAGRQPPRGRDLRPRATPAPLAAAAPAQGQRDRRRLCAPRPSVVVTLHAVPAPRGYGLPAPAEGWYSARSRCRKAACHPCSSIRGWGREDHRR